MQRAWQTAVKILTGLSFTAMYALPQAYTISAKPGAVNYIEGNVSLNGQPLSSRELRAVFLNTSDVLSTDLGKAEILLTPGVFLRLGANSQVRMISPSLVDTQVELMRGAAMVEVDGLLKDNRVSILDHGASINLEKSGLYRFTADENPLAAVIEGKAQVYFGEKKAEIGKGHEALLAQDLKQDKFDPKQEDELYAWSNVRAEYDAASSYQTASAVSTGGFSSYGGSFGGYGPVGYNSFMGAGWVWNNGFNSWSWLPGSGAYYSPFGYGYYGPGLVGYAPIIRVPVRGGGGGPVRVVAVNPRKPPVTAQMSGVTGAMVASPAAHQAARAQVARAVAQGGGYRSAAGAPVASYRGGGGNSAASSGTSRSSGGGFSGGGGASAHASSGGGGSSSHGK
jgi:uncharacterized membrane protein YgcG